jgi:phage FluMu protein Com
MPIEFRCSQCNQLLRVPDQSAGKSARCPKCQTTLSVPGETAAASAPSPTPVADDPFAFMGSSPAGSPPPQNPPPATGGFGGMPPPKPDPFAPSTPFGAAPTAGSSNPFSEPKPIGSVGLGSNPYASPAASASFTPGMMGMPSGHRPGLPWEQRGGSLGTWWETAKLCMLSPTHAYSIMRTEGGIGSPMTYVLLGQGIGALGSLFWQVVFGALTIALIGGNDVAASMGLQLGAQALWTVVYTLLMSTVGLLLFAGVMQVCLMIVGEGRAGYEATYRTYAFVSGSLMWMQWIPIIGALVAAVWILINQVIGLSKAHNADIGKVIIALILEIVAMMVICALPIIFLVVIFSAALAGAAGGFGN